MPDSCNRSLSLGKNTLSCQWRPKAVYLVCPLVLAVLLTSGLPLGGSEIPSFVQAVEEVKRSIFPIVFGMKQEGNRATIRSDKLVGTGFFVGEEGYFVTAGHIGSDLQNAAKTEPPVRGFILVPESHWGRGGQEFFVRSFPFRVVRIDEQNDLALCKTDENPFSHEATKDYVRSVALEEAVPPDGTAVAFTGFPRKKNAPFSAQGIVAAYSNSTGPEQSGLLIEVHAASWKGNSGSPLFLSDGRVVGLVTGVSNHWEREITAARPAKLIKALLLAERAKY
jgi:S1-C subfamily serine protease